MDSPKPFDEIIMKLKNDMVLRFPEQSDQIVSYAENVLKIIEMLIGDSKSIDEKGLGKICKYFASFEKGNAGKMHPQIENEIRTIRILIGEEIRMGKIVLRVPYLENPAQNEKANRAESVGPQAFVATSTEKT